ncbi:MAG: hypothetical protein JNJ91_05250 [Flavobacteriales bacterium]|nr:hypothetical protein [Flavobacteriales bacterium]
MSWIIDQNLDPTLQDWGKAYQELCAIIKEKVPEIKHIDLYYGQDQVVDQNGNWIPYRAPAVFLQFDAAKVDDIGDNTQQLTMDITIYLSVETVQDTNHGAAGQRRGMEFIGLLRKLHMQMHGASGDHFSPLSRVGLQKKADAPPYMYMYAQTYRCVLLDNSTSKQYNFAEAGTLGLEIEPYTAPPEDNLVVVRNSNGTYRVELEGPDEHVLPDVTHTNSDGLPVTLPAMTPFVATACPTSPPPGIAQLRQTGGAQIGGDIPVASGAVVSITAPNGGVSIRNTGGAEVAQAFPMSGQSVIATVPDGVVTILDSRGDPIGSPLEVPSAANRDRTIADSIITRPDGTTIGLRATQPLDVSNYRSGINYAMSETFHSGQTTAFQFGDEGTFYALLKFRSIVHPYPLQVALPGNTWGTLLSLNMYGDNRRFTDRLGGNTYADGIIVDHLTETWYYRAPTIPTANWSTAISAGANAVIEGFDDWFVPPLGLHRTIVNGQGGVVLNYAPFNISISVWTSTTTPSSTAAALPILATGASQSTNKTSTLGYILCRRPA